MTTVKTANQETTTQKNSGVIMSVSPSAVAANTTTKKKPVTSALTLELARQANGLHFGPQADYEKMSNIVVAKNGVFRVVKTPIATFTTQISQMKDDYVIAGLPEMKEGVELHIPKIPFKYWLMPLTFYRDVHKKDGTEASVLFFWNHNEITLPTQYNNGTEIKGLLEDGQLVIYCPQQKNSAALSEFHQDGMVTWLREHTTPLLETHSHHTMGAYFSPTDDANENYYQFYGVYGKITDTSPMFAFRFCSGKHKVIIDPWVLFEKPIVRFAAQLQIDEKVYDIESPGGYQGPWPQVDYPEDWMDQHSVTYRTASGYNTSYGRYGGYYNDWANGKVWCSIQRKYVWPEEKKTQPTTGSGTTALTNTPTGNAGATNYKKKETVVETATSIVNVYADSTTTDFAFNTVVDLIYAICEHGYDQEIVKALEE